MEQLDNPPENSNRSERGASESLQDVVREIENLKATVLTQLSDEIEQLQAKKARLLYETEQLEQRRVQQLEWQQQLAHQIAPAIADRLQEVLRGQIDVTPSRGNETAGGLPPLNDYNDNAYRAIASLDSTLRSTFNTLQQDLSSYQSSLAQQLGQMHSLEQQGTTILEALVERLRQELEAKMSELAPLPSRPEPAPAPPPRPRPAPPPAPVVLPEPPPPAPKPIKVPLARARLGFILIGIYSFALSLQNVVTRIIVKKEPSDLFGGFFRLGSYISPTLGNSVLLLFLRMLFVMVGMLVLANVLYPNTWAEVKRFAIARDRKLQLQALGSGFFLFLSQVLIYVAFGSLTAGVALTLFFIFPIVTVLLSWALFNERPSLIRSLSSVAVFAGVALIAFAGPGFGTVTISLLGLVTATGAGITFALYVLLIQASAKQIHPIPLSALNFMTILLSSLVSLPFVQGSLSVAPEKRTEVLISALILAGLSLLSYLVNNIGISLIGAARASIFGATGPMFTAILAWLIIGEGLNGQEIFGMLVVTAGVAAVSAERLLSRPKAKGK